MEPQETVESPNFLQKMLNSLPKSSINVVIEFVDTETLNNLCQTISEENWNLLTHSLFYEIASTKLYLNQNLHCLDRSAYLTFYSQQNPVFLSLQRERVQFIVSNLTRQFREINTQQQKIFSGMQRLVEEQSINGSQLKETLHLNITDPIPPVAKMRKSNTAIHCNSGFQFYLSQKLLPSSQNDAFIEQVFEELESKLNFMSNELNKENFKWQQYCKKEHNGNQQNWMEKIQQLHDYWFRIDFQNYENYLILEKDPKVSHWRILCNFIVYLLALFDCVVESFDHYIDALGDPFHQFIEFNLRYSVYRNIILSLDSQLQTFFSMLNRVYESLSNLPVLEMISKRSSIVSEMQDQSQEQIVEIQSLKQKSSADFKAQEKHEMQFWHCLLSKWYIFMGRRHFILNTIYSFLLKRISFNNFKAELNQKILLQGAISSKLLSENQHFQPLLNKLALEEEDLMKQELGCYNSCLLEQIESEDLSMELVKEYVEYLVDISVNDHSVHWCGHSSHDMHTPYREFEDVLFATLTNYFQKIHSICHQIDQTQNLFVQVIQKMFDALDKDYLKPVTLKRLTRFVNEKWGSKENNTSGSEKALEMPIQIDFDERDRRLQHFNQEANIRHIFDYSRNILIESEEFYSSLKKSTDTTSTDSEEKNFRFLNIERTKSYMQTEI